MTSRPIALALLLALAIGNLLPLLGQPGPSMNASSEPLPEEVEPNNSLVLANAISPRIHYWAQASATSDSEDWFKVHAPAGMILNATAFAPDTYVLNVDVEIYYEVNGVMGRQQWALTKYNYETACTLTVAEQYYYIRIIARSGSGAYYLDTDVQDPPELSNGQAVLNKALSNRTYDVIDYYKVRLGNTGSAADRLEVSMNKTPAPGDQAWITLDIEQLLGWSSSLRYLDISWGDPLHEQVEAVAPETGWYYIRANCFNGSGSYDLTIKVSKVPTDGNDRPQDAALLYGPSSKVTGSLDQALDHRDCFAIYLDEGESLATQLDVSFPYYIPTIFVTTILRPDGTSEGEWTNYRDTGLLTSIEADLAHASQTGRYVIIAEARVAVTQLYVQNLSEEDGLGDYTLTITPSGHNSAPDTTGIIPKVTTQEDTPEDLDLSPLFTDDNVPQGDRLSYSVVEIKVYEGPAVKAPLTVLMSGALARVVPAANWSGSGVIVFQAKDLFGAAATLSVSFAVTPVNDAPTALTPMLQFDLGENVEMKVVDLDQAFADKDVPYGDQLSYRVEGNQSLPAWVDNGNMLVIGPVMGFGQDQAFTVVTTDSAGATASIPVIVRVADVEHAPRSSTGSMTIIMNEDGGARLALYSIFSDPDPEDTRLSFQWTGNVNVSLLLNDEGGLSFTPVTDWWGTEHVRVTATDHTGKAAKVDLTVRVDPVPDGPVIGNTTPLVGAGPSFVVQLNGTGTVRFSAAVTDKDTEDSGRLAYLWYLDGKTVPGPANEPALTLDSATLKDGNHTLELRVSDGYGLKASVSWSLTVKRPAPPVVLVKPNARQTTSTGAVAVGLWAAVLVAAAEPSRYALFKFLWVPLYTKIRKEEVLDQFVRGRIFGFIEHNPGVTYSQIKRRIGVGNGTLTHHLSMLEKQNYIKAERDGLYKRFYPRDYHIDEDAVELTSLQKDIYVLAKTRPGISQKELSDELQVSERVVSYHIHLLQEARIIRVERSGRKNSLFVEEN